MNKLNKFSRLLASYIDLVIFANLIAIVRLLTNHVGEGDFKLLISIFLYVIFAIFYLCKDMIFSNASIGKHLLGLKLESTSVKPKIDLTFDLCVRNSLTCIAVLLSLFFSYGHSRFNMLLVVGLLMFLLIFNFIFYCCKPDRKLGDYMANLRVVEDTDSNIWNNTEIDKKNLYVMIVTFLLSVPIISLISMTSYITLKGLCNFSDCCIYISGIAQVGFQALIFYLTYKVIVKLVDNVLLKKLMVSVAAVASLSSMALAICKFLQDNLWRLVN